MGIAGIILAAGESTRMGRDKALLAWPPPRSVPTIPTVLDATPRVQTGTLLSAAIQALARWSELVIVVGGRNEAALRPVVYSRAAFLVLNPTPELGQFSSLQTGLNEVLNRGRDAAMITLVDRPPAQRPTHKTLVNAFEGRDRETWSVVPEFQGKHGHPILAAREMIEAFLRAPATSTAREVEHANKQHIAYISVNDPRVTMNLNTPEDYAALRPRSRL
ncbi:MAG: nucleotidyltransferase family protein [Acidobacteria bacterium]|nr:nucleotidyltransferase family protein [Acidobacteriota bacterium]